MSEHLLMVLEDEAAHAAEEPKAVASLLDQQARFAGELRRQGKLADGGRLRPSREGKRVRRRGDHHEVLTGPFTDAGRALGSYYSVNAGDAGEAEELAREVPRLASDAVEARHVMKGQIDADKDARSGKIFAVGVLGSASTEEGWVSVMDRIEAETNGLVRGDAFLGGLRLHAPTRGRRVEGEARRAAFDAPFLESKEVIGGLVFLRATSLDEAVRWALGTPFVAHGTLEIRELWRS